MKIRRGHKEDMAEVLNLIKELATVDKNSLERVKIKAEDLERDGFGENPLFHTFVAINNDEIVGMAMYCYSYSTRIGKTIHLEDLIVKKKMQGSGLGYALYKKIIAQGKKDEVRRIDWNVLEWNTGAIEFYSESGAKVYDDWRLVHMDDTGIEHFLINDLT